MRLNRSRLNWGVFLIVLGAVPLAVRAGAISEASIGDAVRLWPLVLVGIGLAIVLSRTPANFVGGLLVAACFGLVAGSLLTVGPQVGCGHIGGSGTTVSRSGSFSGAASVDLHFACGSATVSTASGTGWQLTAFDARGAGPDLSSSGTSLTLRSRGDFFNQDADSWNVTLPADQQLALSISFDGAEGDVSLSGARLDSASFSINAASTHIDLSGASVGSISISTSAASSAVTLDGASDLSGSVSTNAGSLELCAPPELGLEIRSSEALAGTNLGGAGLVRVGDVWQTPNFATASHHARLTSSTNVGSLNVNLSGGCQ